VQPGTKEYYDLLISEFSKRGMLEAAQNAQQAWTNLQKEQAQTGSYERANQPKLSWRDRMEAKLGDISEQLANDPQNEQLLAAQSNLQKILGINAANVKEAGKWTTHQATQFAPGFQSNDITGEVRPLPKGLGAGGMQGGLSEAQQGLTGEDFLATLPPARAAQVKALAEGRLAFPAGSRAMQSPQWQQLLQDVAQYDPNFDAVNYNARNKTRQGFTSGKEATSLNALNTVLGHIGDLMKSSEDMNNTNFPWINRPWNWIESKVSPDMAGRLKAFQLNANAVAEELERAYRGTGGNVAEIESWKSSFDSADSPAALRKVLQKAVTLLNSKIQALGTQYSQGMGTNQEGLTLLNPHSQEVYDQILSGGSQQPQPQKPVAPAAPSQSGWSIRKK
jgi:hypothetical protein